MSHTAEFLEAMAGLGDDARIEQLTRHVQVHGEASMTQALRRLVHQAELLDTDPESSVWNGLPDGLAAVFAEGNVAHRELAIEVWNTWVDVVHAARAAGTVGSGAAAAPPAGRPHTAPDRSTRVAPAPAPATGAPVAASGLRCPSCGMPSDGLCSRCENREILEDHIEYDRRLYEIDQERIEYDRLRDDRDHYDTSPSYDTSYDPGYDSSYDTY